MKLPINEALAAHKAEFEEGREAEIAELQQKLSASEAALVECFDVIIPQAMPFPGALSEKAAYATKMLPEQLRGTMRVLKQQLQASEALVADLKSNGKILSDSSIAVVDQLRRQIAGSEKRERVLREALEWGECNCEELARWCVDKPKCRRCAALASTAEPGDKSHE